MSFKQHPGESFVAEDPVGVPAPLHVTSAGELIVNTSPVPVNPNGDVIVTAPDMSSLLVELIREVRKSNMYLSLLVGEEIADSDIEE